MKLAGFVAALAVVSAAQPASAEELRVCADPNNLPFSDAQQSGFENKLAALVAAELGKTVTYTWWAQRRGFIRNTLKAQQCDLIIGVPVGYDPVETTRPYYRSTYVFVSRASDKLQGLTLDDPRLRKLRIGVQMVGDDFSNTPPAHALTRRGIVANVRGYMLYGDYRQPSPPSEIVRAVERGDVDVALAWGPLAGYFAARSPVPLRLEPVTPWMDDMQWPMQFDVSVGVRRDNQQLLKDVDGVLTRRAGDIRRLLDSYHVPVVAPAN
jgi:mxaJ protein